MTVNLELEKYLNTLEIELSRVSAAKKAEIILEVKQSIQSRLDSGQRFQNVTEEMGTASQVGQKYLRSLGYVVKKKKSSFFKWFFLAGVGFVLLMALGVGVLAWKFSPLISIDEKVGRFQFLGGLVDIQANSDGSFFAITPDSVEFSGNASMEGLSAVDINIKNGYLKLSTHSDNSIEYKCQADEDLSHLFQAVNGKYSIATGEKGISCQLKIPRKQLVNLKLESGRVNFQKLQASVDAQVTNGSVQFDVDEKALYNYNLSVDKGTIGKFEHSSDPSAFKIKINVVNGVISR